MAGIYRTMGGFKGSSSKLMPLPSDKKPSTPATEITEDDKEFINKVQKRLKNG